MFRLIPIVMLTAFVTGCLERHESARQNKQEQIKQEAPAKKDKRPPCDPAPELFADDPTKIAIEVREGVVHVFKNCKILPGTTKREDVDRILGNHDSEITDYGLYNISFYDKLGIRYGTHKGSGRVAYFDIYLSIPEKTEAQPDNAFSGTLDFGGLRVTAQTTKEDFEQLGLRVTDHSFGFPGYSMRFRDSDVSVSLVKGTKRILYLRFQKPLGR